MKSNDKLTMMKEKLSLYEKQYDLALLDEIIFDKKNGYDMSGLWYFDASKKMYLFFYYTPRENDINCYINFTREKPEYILNPKWRPFRSFFITKTRKLDKSFLEKIKNDYEAAKSKSFEEHFDELVVSLFENYDIIVNESDQA